MNKKESARYLRLLNKEQERILDSLAGVEKNGLLSTERSSDSAGITSHPADQGTDSFERDLSLGLVTEEHEVLKEINEAIGRIERGVYGKCESCAGLVSAERLSALPHARYCLDCQKKSEG